MDTPTKITAQAKEGFEKMSAASTEATASVKDSYSAAIQGAQDYNTKLLDFARTNLTATFDFAQKLSGVKSPDEFVQLSSDHARKQFETFTEQAKELAAMAQKATVATTEPLKNGVTKAFDRAA